MFDFINPTISVLKELIPFLNERAKSQKSTEKMLLIELHDNLFALKQAHENGADIKAVIKKLSNQQINRAIEKAFDFKKIKPGTVQAVLINDERNKRYAGWTCEQLFEKINDKIRELKMIPELFPDFDDKHKGLTLKISNLYFRMKLLAEFIRQK